jgi:hypothetical protein
MRKARKELQISHKLRLGPVSALNKQRQMAVLIGKGGKRKADLVAPYQ